MEGVLVNRHFLIKLRNEIDQVLNKDYIPNRKISKSPVLQSDLTDREKNVLEYVRRNPGTRKQGIVERLNHKGLGYSRVPLFKTISHLEEYGLIVVRPDQNNSQIHHLYVNNESNLFLLIQDFESFKNAFFVLLDKAKEKYA